MPTWIALAEGDILAAKAGALVAAARTAALAAGQADPLYGALANVTARIRAEIAAGGRTVLAADPEALPPSLVALGARMVVRELQGRIDVFDGVPLSDSDKESWRQDVRYLERIARGEITVESSDAPEAVPSVQAPSPSPLISANPRGRSGDQDGA
jgi:phage gp36-like protein